MFLSKSLFVTCELEKYRTTVIGIIYSQKITQYIQQS